MGEFCSLDFHLVEISNSVFLCAESLALKVLTSSQQLFSQHTIAKFHLKFQFNLLTTIMLSFFYIGSEHFHLTLYRLSNFKKIIKFYGAIRLEFHKIQSVCLICKCKIDIF
jgi:hypothetical protein